MKISIITITKNPRIDYLKQALNSVKNSNNHAEIEHLLIDASEIQFKEEIIKICEEYSVQFFNQKSKGLWQAFEEGFECATGEIIGVINSDDFYEPNIIDKIVKNFNDVDFVFGKSRRIDEGGNELYIHTPPIQLLPKLSRFLTFTVSHHTLFFKKSILKEVNFLKKTFDEHYDLVFIVELFARYKYRYLNEIFANFRITGKNASTNSWKTTSKVFSQLNSLPSWMYLLSKLTIIATNLSYSWYLLKRSLRF